MQQKVIDNNSNWARTSKSYFLSTNERMKNKKYEQMRNHNGNIPHNSLVTLRTKTTAFNSYRQHKHTNIHVSSI